MTQVRIAIVPIITPRRDLEFAEFERMIRQEIMSAMAEAILDGAAGITFDMPAGCKAVISESPEVRCDYKSKGGETRGDETVL